ncbi:MAG: RluA family pseudouridine synthase [Alphaproteobacteria bacterium]
MAEPWFLNPVWEDSDLLVINKPAGLAVQGGTKTNIHVDGLLQAYGAAQGQRYYLVHRLDRDTSGILVVAKNHATAQHLATQFRLHTVKKLYLAIVLGVWKQQQGAINAPLIKIGVHEKMVVDQEKGKSAQTDFRLVKRLTQALNLVALTPQTGRTHQLRVHMSYIGHPIIGDGKYGGAPALKQTTQLHLHAYRLTIMDRQDTALTFTAPWPPHFVQTIAATGADPDKILGNL